MQAELRRGSGLSRLPPFPESTQPSHAPAAPCCLLSLQPPPTETTLVLESTELPAFGGPRGRTGPQQQCGRRSSSGTGTGDR